MGSSLLKKIKKLTSYILPHRIKQYTSEISGPLEVNFTNGKLTLDTLTSNYSYGALQSVLRKGIKAIHFDSTIESILILGMGAGSVIESIRNEFHSYAPIDAVELDPTIIEIAKKEFDIERFGELTIYESDAAEFVSNTTSKYDLVIIDLFIINVIPEIFTQEPFLRSLCSKLTPHAKIIFNTIRHTLPREQFTKMVDVLKEEGFTVNILNQVEYDNDLILGARVEF